MTGPENRKADIDPPPVLGTWPRIYCAVILWLALLIALFYLFARRFAP